MDKIYESKISLKWGMEAPGIDPGTSRMLSERSTIWATPPDLLSIGNKIIVWRARPKSFLDNSFIMAGWIRLKNFDHTQSVGHRQ